MSAPVASNRSIVLILYIYWPVWPYNAHLLFLRNTTFLLTNISWSCKFLILFNKLRYWQTLRFMNRAL
jgi:hypothetical protein